MRISDWSSDVCSSDLWNSFEGSAARTFGAHALALGLSYAGYSDDNRTHTTSDWLRASVTGLRDASGGKTRLLGAFVEDAISLTPHLTATLGLRYESWRASRSEEHTSEIQSLIRLSYAVFCFQKK